MEKQLVTVNDIHYRWPKRPVVVVCIDGGVATLKSYQVFDFALNGAAA